MRRVCCTAFASVIGVIIASAAPAPEARPLGGLTISLLLVLSKSQVQEELKLSEDQVKKIEELRAERRQALAALRGLNKEDRANKLQDINKANEAALAKILTRKQLRRAEQIYLQQIGPWIAFRYTQVAAALKLTDEQKDKMALITKESLEESRNNRAKGQVTRELLVELAKRRNEKALNLLTPVQKKKWKELLGEPSKLDPRRSEEKEQPSQGSDRSALAKSSVV